MAIDNRITGSDDDDWNASENWSDGIPTSLSDVLIANYLLVSVTTDVGMINSLSLGSGLPTGLLTVDNGGTLVVNSAAGTDSPSILDGDLQLGGGRGSGQAELEFANGYFTTIGPDSDLSIVGSNAFVDDVGATGTDSAISTISTIEGYLGLADGGSLTLNENVTLVAVGSGQSPSDIAIDSNGSLTINGSLNNASLITVDEGSEYNTDAPADLDVNGVLTNTGVIEIGSNGLFRAEGLVNTGKITISGSIAELDIEGYASNEGSIYLNDYADLSFNWWVSGDSTGYFYLYNGSELEFGGGVGRHENIHFMPGANTLILDHSADFYGRIGNFSQADTIYAKDFGIGTQVNFTENGSGNEEIVSLTNGDKSAQIILYGSFINTDFSFTSSAAGTVIALNAVSSLLGETFVDAGQTLVVMSAAGTDSPGILDGYLVLGGGSGSGPAELEFANGHFTTIGPDSNLSILGSNDFVDDVGATGTDSAISTISTIEGYLGLADGGSLTLNENVTVVAAESGPSEISIDSYGSLTINGSLNNAGVILVSYKGGVSIGRLDVGGVLTNSGMIEIGSNGLFRAEGLVNTGKITISGSIAELDIEGYAANEGSIYLNDYADLSFNRSVSGDSTGYFYLYNESELEFGGGVGRHENIHFMSGANTLILDHSADFYGRIGNFSQADTIYAKDFGIGTQVNFAENGSGNEEIVSLTNGDKSAQIILYGSFINTDFSFTSSAAGTLIALNAVSSIDGGSITGVGGGQTLVVMSAAGMSSPGTLDGSLLVGDSLSTSRKAAELEFASGQFTTIASDGTLDINGAYAFVDDVGAVGTDGAISTISTILGTLDIGDSGSLTLNGNVTNGANGNQQSGGEIDIRSGSLTIDGSLDNASEILIAAFEGGPTTGRLDVAGVLTNTGTLKIGDEDIVTAQGLVNTGNGNQQSGSQIDIDGGSLTIDGSLDNASEILVSYENGSISRLDVAGLLTNTGTLKIDAKYVVTAQGLVNTGNIAISGELDVEGHVTNEGSFYLGYDDLRFNRWVSGDSTGSFYLDNGSELEFGGGVGRHENIHFMTGADTLTFDHSADFYGQIGGFGHGDTIDAKDFGLGTQANFIENASGNGGMLSLTNGNDSAHFLLHGSYSNADFATTSTASGTSIKFM